MHAVGGALNKSALYAQGNVGYGVYATNNSGVYAQNTKGTALQVQGHVLIQGDAVGQATLLAVHTSVTVMTTEATPSSNILLTPLNTYTGTFYATRAAGNFTIDINPAQSSDVVFTYLIIN